MDEKKFPNKGRLFTFGCSFTQYAWPTWADIAGYAFNRPENWGRGGAGNHYIFNSIVECHKSHRGGISEHDTVVVMWSNVHREDRYINRKWYPMGNVFTQVGTVYSEKFLKEITDIRGFYIRDLAMMYATKVLLESIGCKWYFTSMVSIENSDQYTYQDATSEIKDLLLYYKDVISCFRPSVHEVIFNFDWRSRPLYNNKELKRLRENYAECAGPDWPNFENFLKKDFTGVPEAIVAEINNPKKWAWNDMIRHASRRDQHPCPMEHLEYLQKVFPEFEVSQQTVDLITAVDEKVRNEEPYDHLWKPIGIPRW